MDKDIKNYVKQLYLLFGLNKRIPIIYVLGISSNPLVGTSLGRNLEFKQQTRKYLRIRHSAFQNDDYRKYFKNA